MFCSKFRFPTSVPHDFFSIVKCVLKRCAPVALLVQTLVQESKHEKRARPLQITVSKVRTAITFTRGAALSEFIFPAALKHFWRAYPSQREHETGRKESHKLTATAPLQREALPRTLAACSSQLAPSLPEGRFHPVLGGRALVDGLYLQHKAGLACRPTPPDLYPGLPGDTGF